MSAKGIVNLLHQIDSTVCKLASDNTLCPKQGGIAYQDIPHYQTTTYRTGDEGYRVSNNLMDQNNPAFPLYTQKLDLSSANPFTTLFYNNIFGSRERFTDINGLQVYGDGITVDHLTKRMYYQDLTNLIDWDTTIDLVEGFTIGGFTDWHLSTRAEIFFVINSLVGPTVFGGITMDGPTKKTSTTHSTSTNAYEFTATNNTLIFGVKIGNDSAPLAVRIFSESDLNI